MLEELTAIMYPILLSIFGAIMFYASSGYLKQEKKFDPQTFCITIAIGAIVGFLAYVLGIAFEPAYQMLLSTGATVAIESWVKAIYRKLEAWKDSS